MVLETQKMVICKRSRNDEMLMGRNTHIHSKPIQLEEVSAIRKQARTGTVPHNNSKPIGGSSEHERSRRQQFSEKSNPKGTDDDDADDPSWKRRVRSKRNKGNDANESSDTASASRTTLNYHPETLAPYLFAATSNSNKRHDQVYFAAVHLKTHGVTLYNKLFKCVICNRLFKDIIDIGTHMYVHRALFENYGISSDEHDKDEDLQPEVESLPVPSNEPVKLSESISSRKKQVHSSRNEGDDDKENGIDVETSKKSFKDSINIRRESKCYACAECNQRFDSKSQLVVHTRIHSDERPFQCKTCDKCFRRQHHLNNHLRTHSGERPFECKTCHKRFRGKGTLTNHLRIHSGERPFQCRICDSKFSQKITLVRHSVTHNVGKPFSCDICKKSYRQKLTISKHMKMHIGERDERLHQVQRVQKSA